MISPIGTRAAFHIIFFANSEIMCEMGNVIFIFTAQLINQCQRPSCHWTVTLQSLPLLPLSPKSDYSEMSVF